MSTAHEDPSATQRRARRRVLVVVASVLAVALTVSVAGLVGAGRGQAALATAIRDSSARSAEGFPLARPLVGGGPTWALPGGGTDFAPVDIRIDDVPLAGGGAGTVTLVADSAHWDRDTGLLHVRDATVALELGADALARPLGLTGAYLTAFADGSLAGGAEDRARLSGRTAPTPGGPAGGEKAAWELRVGLDGDRATAVIQQPDRSTAGTDLTEGPTGDGAGAPSAGPPARPGDGLAFDAAALPLDTPPTEVFVRARTLTVSAHLDTAAFPPAALAEPRRFHRTSAEH